MNKGIFMAGVAAIALVLPVAAAENSPSQAFIKEAVEGNLWEVQAGQLARSKASNEELRKFGATLNTDHGEATRKAAEAAQKLGVTPPTERQAQGVISAAVGGGRSVRRAIHRGDDRGSSQGRGQL